MARDPDYIDPAVLRKRAAEVGGPTVIPTRPRVHRVDEAGVRIAGSRTLLKNVRAGERAIDTSKSRINIS